MRTLSKVSLILLVTTVFAAIVLDVYCAEAENPVVLTLDEFILKASSKDRRFEEILIDKLKLKYKKALGLPAGDLVFAVKSQCDFFLNPDQEDPENTVSLSKLFPYTGTNIEAEYESSVSSTTREVSSEFTVSISQPIAENAFGRNTRLLDKIIGIETDVANFQIVEAYEDYLASLIQLYYNWYAAYENVRTAQNSYNENVKLLENIKERQKHKIALPIDVNKISLQVVAKKENLITLRNTYSEYLNLVKESIRHQDKDDPVPDVPSVYENAVIDFNKNYPLFNTESRTARILKMLEDKSSLEVDKYADELLPSIDIIAGYSLSGDGHDIANDREHMIYSGISMDWPLPGELERARYETAKIDRRETVLSSENIHLRLRTDLKNLNDQIVREKELIAIAQDKIEFAQSILDDERENYSLGRTTLNDLIDEVNKLEDNKFNKIFHQVELKRLIVEWLRLTDNLVMTGDIK